MKYNDYKKLTPEQKEEYDWRFHDKYYAPSFLFWGLLIMILMIVIAAEWLAISNTPQIAASRPHLDALVVEGLSYIRILWYGAIIESLFTAIFNINLHFQEKKWRKSLCQNT